MVQEIFKAKTDHHRRRREVCGRGSFLIELVSPCLLPHLPASSGMIGFCSYEYPSVVSPSLFETNIESAVLNMQPSQGVDG